MGLNLLFNRETVYRFLYDNLDENNNISLSQGEIGGILGMGYQHVSKVFKEFVTLGLMEKTGHKFTPLYEPDRIPWDKYEVLRRQYSEHTMQSKQMENTNE